MPSPSENSKIEYGIALLSLVGIAVFLWLHYAATNSDEAYKLIFACSLSSLEKNFFQTELTFGLSLKQLPLLLVLALGGIPLVIRLMGKLLQGDFGADLLAGIAIITAIGLNEYLAGSLVVLMLSGGAVLENYAVSKASAVLEALAKRMPSIAHKHDGDGLTDLSIDRIVIGDVLVVLPHEICPVDGTVLHGSSTMDESYLTGEPYMMSKTAGSTVMSGAVNGDSSLTIRADKLAVDSRYAKIMEVMRSSEQHRPKLRRLGDQDMGGRGCRPIGVGIHL